MILFSLVNFVAGRSNHKGKFKKKAKIMLSPKKVILIVKKSKNILKSSKKLT